MEGYAIDGDRAGKARCALRDRDGKQRFSQAAAARALSIHPVTLNRIENGKARASLEVIERMCELYDVSREYLLGQPEEIDPVEAVKEEMSEALADIARGFTRIAAAEKQIETILAEHLVKAAA